MPAPFDCCTSSIVTHWLGWHTLIARYLGGASVDEPAQQRLWEHRQALNGDFNSISNYFMLAQSFLLVVAVTIGTSLTPRSLAVTLLGLTLTIVWLYVQSKQRFLLDQLKDRCAKELPEYAATRSLRVHPIYRLSITKLLSILPPLLFAATWVTILVTL